MDIVGIDQEEQVHRRNRLGRNCKQIAEPTTNPIGFFFLFFLTAQGRDLQSSSGDPPPRKRQLFQRAGDRLVQAERR